MIKGNFSKTAVFLHLFLLLPAGGFIWIFMTADAEKNIITFYIMLPVMIIYLFYAILSPFISIKTVVFNEGILLYKYLLIKKIYKLNDIDGYFTMEVPSKENTYETIYPVSRNKILSPISSFYISNYDEVKEQIPLRFIGKVKFSWKNYMLVLLFKKYNELDR